MESFEFISEVSNHGLSTVSESTDFDLIKLGVNLITKFHVLMRISQIYDSKNVALNQFINESLHAINTIVEREGILAIKIVKDDFFINDKRLPYSVEGFTSFKYLLTKLRKRLIGEVIFKSELNEEILREFIYALVNLEEDNEDNVFILQDHLLNKGINIIEVNPLEIYELEELSPKKEDSEEVAKKVFFETINTMKDVISNIKGKQFTDTRRLKRLAQKAVHLAMKDESILLGMATIKNYDEYTFNHSVNVSIYSLAMGRRLGLSRKTLTELGITALLHDIGKSKIPKEILNKPSSLNEDEWRLMKRHPLMGVEIVLNLKQLGEINPRMVIGIFDHHLRSDLSGYPRLFRRKGVSLFGRIIQIADSYDAMTTPRVYKKIPYTPEQALSILLRERGSNYDPILLKLFIGIVGVYPIGSLVLLDTDEIGVVFKTNPDPQLLDRPKIILVGKDEKRGVSKEIVDLSERNKDGSYKRNIVKTLDPYKYHIDIAKYFI